MKFFEEYKGLFEILHCEVVNYIKRSTLFFHIFSRHCRGLQHFFLLNHSFKNFILLQVLHEISSMKRPYFACCCKWRARPKVRKRIERGPIFQKPNSGVGKGEIGTN